MSIDNTVYAEYVAEPIEEKIDKDEFNFDNLWSVTKDLGAELCADLICVPLIAASWIILGITKAVEKIDERWKK